jgi:uncharacterized protein YjbI with pentapeptide repeats
VPIAPVHHRLLRESHFDGEEFSDLDLDGADLSDKEFTRCTFRKVACRESRWTGTRLEDCIIESSDLGRIQTKNLALRGVAFVRCRMTGIDWTDAARNPVVLFDECNLQYGSFIETNLAKTRFLRCKIADAQFVEARLVETDFTGSDLSGSRFEHCDLRKALFHEATGVWFDPAKNKVKDARINLATAVLIARCAGLVVAGIE